VKDKIKKVFGSVVLCSLILFILTSCSSDRPTKAEPSIKDIDEKIKESVDISNMNKGDSTKLEKLYNINVEDVEDFVLYTPATNIEANEILIMKVKDSVKTSDVKEKILKRVEGQSNNFKDYLPEEYYLIEKHVLKVRDNYILFTISEEAETIEKIFNASFK
jgi:hypothetical protein